MRRLLVSLAVSIVLVLPVAVMKPASARPSTVSQHGCTVKVGFSTNFPGTAYIENQGGCRYIGITEYDYTCTVRAIEIGMWNPPLWYTIYNNGIAKKAYYAVGHAIAYDGTSFWVYTV